MSRGHNIQGFDYRKGHTVAMPINDWRQVLREVMQQGGSRRVESGETFIKNKAGELVAEAYQVIGVQP
jgi:hypothetical protein